MNHALSAQYLIRQSKIFGLVATLVPEKRVTAAQVEAHQGQHDGHDAEQREDVEDDVAGGQRRRGRRGRHRAGGRHVARARPIRDCGKGPFLPGEGHESK